VVIIGIFLLNFIMRLPWLNTRDNVKESTRQRIEEIIRLLNYKPSRAGKVLVSYQKKIKIGCIMIKVQNPFDELHRGICVNMEEYSSYGIEVLVERVDVCGETQCRRIDALLTMRISALVIQPIHEPLVAEKLIILAMGGLPIVATNTDWLVFSPFATWKTIFLPAEKPPPTCWNLLPGENAISALLQVLTGYIPTLTGWTVLGPTLKTNRT
jgi:hypothetical protein